MASMGKVKAALETVATISIIVVAAATVWVIVAGARRPVTDGTTGPVRPPGPPTYEAGDTFDVVEGLDFSGAPVTAVVWVRSTCHFCTESMPFYQRLVAQPRRGRVVFMSDEPVDVLRGYLDQHGVAPDQFVSVEAGSMKLSGTPTLVFVTPDRTVESAKLGKVRTAAAEAEVIARLVGQ